MKITIVAAGKIKEKYLSEGIGEFMKRLRPYAQVQIVEIGEEKMKENPSEAEKEKTLTKEGERLLRQVPEPFDSAGCIWEKYVLRGIGGGHRQAGPGRKKQYYFSYRRSLRTFKGSEKGSG